MLHIFSASRTLVEMEPYPEERTASPEQDIVGTRFIDPRIVQDAIDDSSEVELYNFASDLGGFYHAISETAHHVKAIDDEIRHHEHPDFEWIDRTSTTGINIIKLTDELAEQYKNAKTTLLETRTAEANAFLKAYPGICYVSLEDDKHALILAVDFTEGTTRATIASDEETRTHEWTGRRNQELFKVDTMQLPVHAQDIVRTYVASL